MSRRARLAEAIGSLLLLAVVLLLIGRAIRQQRLLDQPLRAAPDTWGWIGLAAALLALAAAIGLQVGGAAHFRTPLWYGLIFPAGYAMGAVMALDSVRRRPTGQIRWKGRTYP